jgi:hypothetical protein
MVAGTYLATFVSRKKQEMNTPFDCATFGQRLTAHSTFVLIPYVALKARWY